MNAEGTSRCSTATPPREVYGTWQDLWKSAPCCRRPRTRPARPGPPASPQGKVGLMPYPATLLSSTTSFDVGVAGIPGPNGGASTFVGGDGIGVSKDSQEAAQAWNFLAW